MATRGASTTRGIASNPTLVGAAIILAVVLTVFLSYNANKGLPYVPTITVFADVPDAAELVKGSEVRTGGARVGQVITVKAMPSEGGKPPFARLELKLDQNLRDQVPVNSIVQIRPRSILGAKYVDLTFGDSAQKVLDGGTLDLERALPTPELDEAFNTFDPETSEGLKNAIIVTGDSLAGRGTAINETIVASRRLIGPLERVLRVLGEDRTDLDGFVAGAAAVASALAPEAETLGSLFDHGATTLAAVDAAGDAIGRTFDEAAATELVGIRALRKSQPVLDDAVALTRALRPAARRLPATSLELARAVEAGTPLLRRVPGLAGDLRTTLVALGQLARDPNTGGAVRKLLATVESLRGTLPTLLPAQIVCNIGPLFMRNTVSSISDGDVNGTWFSLIGINSPSQMFHNATPAADLHANHTPHENAQECESGNEPFIPGQQIGNPPGNQPASTEITTPPPGVRERARRAGLLDHIPGASR